ncbi:hypothetical protein [Cohnella caldifontis]|uniref:hypothetical protein n=1 Tax=Cohnella caldifontis TaxID=3027471 RepID=UPI0023ED73D4|nr:hypothetical protein [Cohnella sp. YIM B05605]
MNELTPLTEQAALLAPIVAAYVGIAKEFKVPSRYNHILSLAVAAVFVLVPDTVRQTLTTISVIGLTASGLYQFAKNKKKESS